MEAEGPRAARQPARSVEDDRIVEREHAGYVEAPEPLPPMGGPGGPTLSP
jgi:hypothetical protein